MRRMMVVLAATALTVAACGGSDGGAKEAGPSGDGLKVVKVVTSGKILESANVLLTEAMGVYEKHGLDVQIDFVPSTDGLALLTTGRIDVEVGFPAAGLMNAVSGGAKVRAVASGITANPDSKGGIYVNKKLLGGKPFEMSMLKGQKIASIQGIGGTVSVSMNEIFQENGFDVGDVTFQTMASPDIIPALESGAINVGILTAAGALELSKDSCCDFVAPSIPGGVSNPGIAFADTLLSDDPELGQAFLDATSEGVATYLTGDYRKNPEVLAKLVEILEIPEETLAGTPPPLFKADMRPTNTKFFENADAAFRTASGVLQYDKPLPLDKLWDPQFIDNLKQN